ncbi:MAG: circularly permuted type 2 ATP-grasp protein [Deltaproteobacteria bacterium]|nr:circularly permuted type 2 ATP-grasp protein [Deltaproteobacteria bacterium]
MFSAAPSRALVPEAKLGPNPPAPRGMGSLLTALLRREARDEAVDALGRVRPHYQAVEPLARHMSRRRLGRALRQSRRAFRGDNALHPIPRVLVASEYERLRKGVTQRGTALRMFLADHYSGQKTYAKVISPVLVDEIIARNGEAGYAGLIDPKTISFPYGPDIMRAKDGRFYVIEDNTGFIGGPGDLLKAREILTRSSPEIMGALSPLDEPNRYYARLVERAKALSNPAGGRVIMFQVPPYADHEDDRLRQIMKSHGVDVLTPSSKHRLVIKDDGLFVRETSKSGETQLERVGYVFLNGEHKWLDASHPSTRPAFLLGEARDWLGEKSLGKKARAALVAALVPDPSTGKVDDPKLEAVLREHQLLDAARLAQASAAKGLMSAIYAGQVATNYSPGVDFVGDKAFKGYVDDLVRFYLGEEPVLPSIPVTRFTQRTKDGLEILDEATLHQLFDGDAYRAHVFKVVDGRGGKGIYIGPKMKPEEVPPLVSEIREDPTHYVAEPFTPLSTLAGHIVDLRLISTVDPGDVVVSPTPWSRGVPIDGDGKVNLSQKGKEFGVVVVADPKPLAKRYRRSTRPRGITSRPPQRVAASRAQSSLEPAKSPPGQARGAGAREARENGAAPRP